MTSVILCDYTLKHHTFKMDLPWKRPDNVPFPQVWLTFKAKDLNSDDLVEYRVQDLPLDRYEDAIDHMCAHFLVEEPMCESLGLVYEENSVKASRDLWKHVVQQKIVLACFKEGSDEIIGINMVAIAHKGEKESLPTAEKLIKVLTAMAFCGQQFNVYESYNVDKYMTAFGLSVNAKYRGRGIGEYILRARIPLARAVGISVTSTVFTATASQKLAKRAGFELNYEITYEALSNLQPACVFPDIETKSIVVMSIKI